MTSTRHLGWTALALLALVGCDAGMSTPTPAPTPAPSAPAPAPAPTPTAPKDATETKSMPTEPTKGADAGKLSDEEIAEIKKLPSADDQALALAQVTCPVSGDKLGGDMGVPIKQLVDGKTFFICCSGCEKAVKSDPAAVLAKLKK